MNDNNLDFKARNIVNSDVFCMCPSLLLDALNSDDGFLSAMFYSDDDGDDEPLEFWLVSNWLANKLKEHGGRVYDLGDGNIWGRMTSGQAIYMDSLIRDIAE